MKRLVVASIIMLFGWTGGAVAGGEKFYSIQVHAVPMAEIAAGLATYRALREKGYLAYTYRAQVDGEPRFRVAVGAFGGTEAAAAFGKFFSAREKLDHLVARAPVRIVVADGGDFVVTPSALWTRRGAKVREVFTFSDPPPEYFKVPGGIRLMPSPDRKAMAFQYGNQVYVARLGDDEAKWIAGSSDFSPEDISGPVPHWSPSGRYIAFHDYLEWEARTSLWVVRADGGELRTLIDNQTAENQNAVKGFIWHPTEDRILFIDGYAWGTMAPGGDIRSVDMDGTVTMKLAADNEAHRQFVGPLTIRDGYLHYRMWEFEDDKDEPVLTDIRTPLSDL